MQNHTLCVKLHTSVIYNYTLCKATFFFAISEQFLSCPHWKFLHLTETFYTTNSCDGCDKFKVWLTYLLDRNLYRSQILRGRISEEASILWKGRDGRIFWGKISFQTPFSCEYDDEAIIEIFHVQKIQPAKVKLWSARPACFLFCRQMLTFVIAFQIQLFKSSAQRD